MCTDGLPGACSNNLQASLISRLAMSCPVPDVAPITSTCLYSVADIFPMCFRQLMNCFRGLENSDNQLLEPFFVDFSQKLLPCTDLPLQASTLASRSLQNTCTLLQPFGHAWERKSETGTHSRICRWLCSPLYEIRLFIFENDMSGNDSSSNTCQRHRNECSMRLAWTPGYTVPTRFRIAVNLSVFQPHVSELTVPMAALSIAIMLFQSFSTSPPHHQEGVMHTRD